MIKKFFLITILGVNCLDSEILGNNINTHGVASWYSIKCNGGTHTASGIPLRDHHMTAAHKRLPFGSVVRVINIKSKKEVVVKITDDGPHVKGRVIDLTKGAFKKIAGIKDGLVKVRLEVVSVPEGGVWRE